MAKQKEEKKDKGSKFVTKDDFDKLVGLVGEVSKAVAELKFPYGNTQPEPTAPVAPVEPRLVEQVPEQEIKDAVMADETTVNPDKMPVPPAWRKMVDEILGIDFGIDVVYPQAGSGFMFKLIVPTEKSNASAAHKEFYKVDIRTKPVSYSEGTEGIRKFCESVAQNLKNVVQK